MSEREEAERLFCEDGSPRKTREMSERRVEYRGGIFVTKEGATPQLTQT